MENTQNKVGSNQLLQARDQSLQQVEKGMLRPHGKLWGMDVFSWYNPMVFELENTLLSFPAPVLWFGNEKDVLTLLDENRDSLSNVRLICVHDNQAFSISEQVLEMVESTSGTATLKEALGLIQALKRDHGIFLFTASGNDWKERKEEFEFFLNLHQAI